MQRTIEIIREGMTLGIHPGAQLFVWRNGATIIDEAFGEARIGLPMRVETRQLWMSAGKPLTAIAMLQQIERGKASLETRVAEIVPEFAQNGKDPITIRHLLTHTSGFRGPLNSFTPGPWEAIIDRCCALRLEPGWVPGKKAGYHVASSWFILGEIVRRLDGRNYARYVRDDVLAPVGATRSSVGISESEYDETDALVSPDFAGNRVVDAWTVSRPPGNARGPVRELGLIYISLLRHDGGLVAPEYSKQMIARQREGMIDETFKQKIDWGLGVKLDSKHYGVIEQYGYGPHASNETFGHSGNQCSCAFADPKHDLVAAWCTNGMPGESTHQKRQHAINSAIYEDLGIE